LRKPMMLLLRIEEGQQIPLIHEVHSDDVTVQTPPRNPALHNCNSLIFGCPAG
jgi:hypothetical protein